MQGDIVVNAIIWPQAFDVPGVSENSVASNMVRNGIFYLTIENTVSDHIWFVSHYRKYSFWPYLIGISL